MGGGQECGGKAGSVPSMTAPAVKLIPFTVSVNAGPPAVALAGDKLVMVGIVGDEKAYFQFVTSALASTEPSPVTGSHPGPALYPNNPFVQLGLDGVQGTILFPCVISWNITPRSLCAAKAYSVAFTLPCGSPVAWITRAIMAANVGAAAEVPFASQRLPELKQLDGSVQDAITIVRCRA